MTQNSRGEVLIRIAGTFDAEDAGRLSTWLGEVPSDGELVLDFTGVRDFSDFGLAAVASELASRAGVTVRGLTRHQERLLRYFGVELDHGAPAGASGTFG